MRRVSFQRRIGVRRSILIISVVLMALVFSNSQSASATIITVEVTGVVDYFNTEGGFALDGSVNIGSAMTGSLTYDTETPDEFPTNEDIGGYPLISILMTIGNYTFTHDPTSPDYPFFIVGTVDPGYIASSDALRFDGTVYIDGSPKIYDDITWSWTYLELFNLWTSSSEYITTDTLPDLDSWPELSVFDNRREFRVNFLESLAPDPGSFDIYGEVTSLTVTPEPATVLLLGLGGLALLRKRRT